MATKPAVPPMHPRERLTEKALQGISTYASVKAGDLPIHYMMVRYVLDAERMPRERLYAWLEDHGYQWRPKAGRWVQRPGKSAGQGKGQAGGQPGGSDALQDRARVVAEREKWTSAHFAALLDAWDHIEAAIKSLATVPYTKARQSAMVASNKMLITAQERVAYMAALDPDAERAIAERARQPERRRPVKGEAWNEGHYRALLAGWDHIEAALNSLAKVPYTGERAKFLALCKSGLSAAQDRIFYIATGNTLGHFPGPDQRVLTKDKILMLRGGQP